MILAAIVFTPFKYFLVTLAIFLLVLITSKNKELDNMSPLEVTSATVGVVAFIVCIIFGMISIWMYVNF